MKLFSARFVWADGIETEWSIEYRTKRQLAAILEEAKRAAMAGRAVKVSIEV